MAANQRQLIKDIQSWGKHHGVVLDGVKAKAIPHRGIGIVATRALKPGDKIITIPLNLTRNIKNIHPSIVAKTLDAGVTNLTVHSLLAVDLLLSLKNTPSRSETNPESWTDQSKFNPWHEVLPSQEDFAKTTPYFFPPELQALLPKPARKIVEKQVSIIDHDFAILSGISWSDEDAIRVMSKDEFVHAWFIVNTRTFHYVPPGMDEEDELQEEEEKLSWDDQMALVPIADLINHDDGEGCGVGFSEEGYVVTVERGFEKGEEVSFCYGRHGNDSLMAEYGFVIDPGPDGKGKWNRWDVVDLEDAIVDVGRSSFWMEIGGEKLEGKSLTIDWEGRIDEDVVVVLKEIVERKEEGADGDGDETDDEKVREFLRHVLQALRDNYSTVLGKRQSYIGKSIGEPSQWDILLQRWGQIFMISDKAWDVLSSSEE